MVVQININSSVLTIQHPDKILLDIQTDTNYNTLGYKIISAASILCNYDVTNIVNLRK